MTRSFESSRVTTLLGYDPLLQFLHENDWLDAVELTLERDAPGPFNLAGDGVLPLSTLLRLAGKSEPAASASGALPRRLSRLDRAKPAIRPPRSTTTCAFCWVVDTQRARDVLGFEPVYTTQEAWMSFVVARKLRGYR